MPISRLSRTQRTSLRTALGDNDLADTIIEQLDAVQDGTVSGINNTQPTYVAGADYTEMIDGVQVVHLTVNAVKSFFENTMSLEPKHVNALREEGITHLIDLTMLDSKDFESVIHSMKENELLNLVLLKSDSSNRVISFSILLIQNRP